ncbi:squalene--hopene cyclase [Thermolongibacillus altinsuensis]|uniref:squalene--hopene cyclase n=1 Tax=Thermolongibacillus altinsuensis TaxID=575256 RepID=UPI001046E7AA|nr:squalene--hopene cyclase [Thermolongibacillus altinsuensis]
MANVRLSIQNEMNRIVNKLKYEQSSDGSWHYPFETGISTDAYMIILLRTLEINDEDLIQALVERIERKQEENGAWKLFYDEGGGNVTATVEAYYALLYSGYRKKSDPNMQAAKRRILEMGGIESVQMFAKFMLALTGQYPWPKFFPIPIEMILLPLSFPINFFDFSVYGRANLTPIFILADNQYRVKTKRSPDLSDLFVSRLKEEDDWSSFQADRSFLSYVKQAIKHFIDLPKSIHSAAVQHAKQYMLNRIEPDGTFYSYFSSTFFMIFALLSLGYPKNHLTITKAINGLKSFICQINGNPHMQYTTATVWNTSLVSYALQEAGVSAADPVIQKANRYLLSRQHVRYGDWTVHNPYSMPGGWGFSNVNTINPDVDDTTASLRAIHKWVMKEPLFRQAWDRGLNWLFSMQNDDGGYAAFEKNVNKRVLHHIPIQGAEFILTDPSTADLTGRTLDFFGNFTNLSKQHPAIQREVEWLMDHQEKNGAWYGRWGICYIYGTWAAVTGLISVGVSPKHPVIQKAVKWLLKIQNNDGGWGESCKSDIEKTYVPLGASTLTHTAWALGALIAVFGEPIPEIQAGIKFLLQSAEREDWTTSYPTGQGMAGGFYIHYHSYPYVFPLLALSHYQKKFEISHV